MVSVSSPSLVGKGISAVGSLLLEVSCEVGEVGCSRCASSFSLLILGRVGGVAYGLVIIAVTLG